ncbi:hypothetical protein [Herminiimonas contaminans]|uniref:Uncharacterized protein n=1 Tax=Herminiimonas contaminans TaxID=1111140 RepID=A0ABS0EQX6_9BURK|nr:hypothetical protein [Herminiimonas contaminans]MBF8176943.1 hypothetical protein [Herminiimonas contaminans]
MKKLLLTDESLTAEIIKAAAYASNQPASDAMTVFVARLCGGIEKIAPQSHRTLMDMLIPPASRPSNDA